MLLWPDAPSHQLSLPPLFVLFFYSTIYLLPFLKPWMWEEARRRESEALDQVVSVLGSFVSCSTLTSIILTFVYAVVQGSMLKWTRLPIETAELKVATRRATSAGLSLADYRVLISRNGCMTRSRWNSLSRWEGRGEGKRDAYIHTYIRSRARRCGPRTST